MPEEIIETKDEEQLNAQSYIKNLEDLKKNTVSKELYEKLQQENKQLADSLANGIGQVKEEDDDVVIVPTIEEANEKMKNAKNDLEFIEGALDYREACMAKKDGYDPFVGRGHNITPSKEAYESAQRAADVFKECVEAADGDNEKFIAELQYRTIDVAIPRRK